MAISTDPLIIDQTTRDVLRRYIAFRTPFEDLERAVDAGNEQEAAELREQAEFVFTTLDDLGWQKEDSRGTYTLTADRRALRSWLEKYVSDIALDLSHQRHYLALGEQGDPGVRCPGQSQAEALATIKDEIARSEQENRVLAAVFEELGTPAETVA